MSGDSSGWNAGNGIDVYQGELIIANANALGSDNFVWVDHGLDVGEWYYIAVWFICCHVDLGTSSSSPSSASRDLSGYCSDFKADSNFR